jgi:hypothetical protein
MAIERVLRAIYVPPMAVQGNKGGHSALFTRETIPRFPNPLTGVVIAGESVISNLQRAVESPDR